jgi:hypothetical protein
VVSRANLIRGNVLGTIVDGFGKSLKTPFSVIPAKAGIQEIQGLLDPGFRRGDESGDFLRVHHC